MPCEAFPPPHEAFPTLQRLLCAFLQQPLALLTDHIFALNIHTNNSGKKDKRQRTAERGMRLTWCGLTMKTL